MASPPEIRQATPDDRAKVIEVVAAAFRGDPAWAFLTGGDYQDAAPRLAAAFFELRVPSGNVWVTSDVSALAMWESPKRDSADARPKPLAEAVWHEYRSAAGERTWERLKAYEEALLAVAPAGAHWYLGTLATHPARQREGLATAVIAPVLRQADRDGLPCSLETSTDANRRFYERRGFQTTELVRIPAGPPTWWLRRPPRPSA